MQALGWVGRFLSDGYRDGLLKTPDQTTEERLRLTGSCSRSSGPFAL
jgi:hypothetical protein